MPAKVSIPTRPTTALVKNSASSIESKWQKTCKDFKDRLSEVNKNLINVYYDVGTQVLAITNHPDSWGNRTSEEFGRQLDLSKHTIAAAARFSQMITPYELNVLIKYNIKWSAAIALIVVKDPGTRHILCDLYKKNNWTTDELKAEINRMVPQALLDSPTKHGGLNHTICFKKIASQAGEFTKQSLPQFLEFVQAYNDTKEDERSNKAVEAYKSSIDNLKMMLQNITATLDKLGENDE